MFQREKLEDFNLEELPKKLQNVGDLSGKIPKKKSLFAQAVAKDKASNHTAQDAAPNEVISDVIERPDNLASKERRFSMEGFPSLTSLRYRPIKAEIEKESDSYLESKGILELDKLEWTREAIQIPVSDPQIRFNFSGEVITDKDSQEFSGLYHHGDEPANAGYCISELLHFAKSTFATQRSMAFTSLKKIVTRLYDGYFNEFIAVNIIAQLKKHNAFLAARVGIDAKHETVIQSSLEFLLALLGCKERYFEPYDKSLLFSLKIYAIETAAMERFFGEVYPSELKQELDNSMSSILATLNSDPILGLLMTNAVVRFRYLLSDKDASLQRKLSIILILSKISIHSISSAEDVLACDGLIDLLRKDIRLSFENPNNSSTSHLIAVFRLVRFLCQSSREACVALLNSRLIHDCIKVLCAPGITLAIHCRELKIHVLNLLNICVAYNLTEIFDEHRALLFQCGESNVALYDSDPDQINLDVLLSWTNLLLSLRKLKKIDSSTEFVYLVAMIMENTNGQTAAVDLNTLCIQVLHVFDEFYDCCTETTSLPELKFHDEKKETVLPWIGLGIFNSAGTKTAMSLLCLAEKTAYLSAKCKALRKGLKRGMVSKQQLQQYVNHFKMVNIAQAIAGWDDTEIPKFIGTFGNCVYLFLDDFLGLLWDANNIIKAEIISPKTFLHLSSVLLDHLLPTQDDVLFRLLRRLNLSHNEFLTSIFSGINTTQDDLHRSSFLVQADSTTALPLDKCWHLRYAETIHNAGDICQISDLLSWLKFVAIVEKTFSGSYDPEKFFHVMNIFWLTDSAGQHHFHDPVVQVQLRNVLLLIVPNYVVTPDNKMLQKLNSFLSLIDHYQAVSYGNELFGRCLLWLSSGAFPNEFRISFWSKMAPPFFRHFNFDIDDLLGPAQSYFTREISKDLLESFKTAKRYIYPDELPLLYSLVAVSEENGGIVSSKSHGSLSK